MDTFYDIVERYRHLEREMKELGKVAAKKFCPLKIGQDVAIPKEALLHVGKTGRIYAVALGSCWRVPKIKGSPGDRHGWKIQVLVHKSDGTVGNQEAEWWIAL